MKNFFIAFLISFFWVLFAKEQYLYEGKNFIIFGINMYSLFAWTFGLFLSIYVFEKIIKIKKNQFLYYFIFYLFALLFVETVFYHIFNVKNSVGANFSGLAICDCLHAPTWMKAVYFFMGPLYFYFLNFSKSRLFKKCKLGFSKERV